LGLAASSSALAFASESACCAASSATRVSAFCFACSATFLDLGVSTFLDIFDGVPQFTCSKADITNGINIVELLAEKTAIFPSKGEARKMIAGGGVAINKVKVESDTETIGAHQLINDKFLIVQKGKKNYFLKGFHIN
jgi:tyrosyl-tRNA synthetase